MRQCSRGTGPHPVHADGWRVTSAYTNTLIDSPSSPWKSMDRAVSGSVRVGKRDGAVTTRAATATMLTPARVESDGRHARGSGASSTSRMAHCPMSWHPRRFRQDSCCLRRRRSFARTRRVSPYQIHTHPCSSLAVNSRRRRIRPVHIHRVRPGPTRRSRSTDPRPTHLTSPTAAKVPGRPRRRRPSSIPGRPGALLRPIQGEHPRRGVHSSAPGRWLRSLRSWRSPRR